jgi:hypothetical protein
MKLILAFRREGANANMGARVSDRIFDGAPGSASAGPGIIIGRSFSPIPDADRDPNQLGNAECPWALNEKVRRGESGSSGIGQREPRTAFLEEVATQHGDEDEQED